MVRMVRAELLRLRRSRTVWLGAAVTVLVLPLAFLALVAMVETIHTDGGWFAEKCVEILLGPGLLGATLIGVVAGTADRVSGVLPVLVATGRPRGQLFAARVPAVLIAVVLLSLAFWAVVCALGFALHAETPAIVDGVRDAPALTGAEALDLLPRILAVDVVLGLATLGICTAGLAAAPAVGAVLGLALGIMPMVALVERTPDWILGLMPPLATSELVGGSTFVGPVAVPVGWAVLGLALWTVGALGVGRWRLLRADV
jgi:hypothetical protein